MISARKGAALLAALPLAVAGWAFRHAEAHAAPASDVRFETMDITMDGMSERPKQVKTDATGTATFSYAGTGPISYVIKVKALSSNPTAAHIHGPADAEGAAGPIVTFKLDSVIPNGTIATGSIGPNTKMSISLDSLKHLMRDARAYVNVHSVNNPGGEIRGQFKKYAK